MKVTVLPSSPLFPGGHHELLLQPETDKDSELLRGLIHEYQLVGCGIDPDSGNPNHVRLLLRTATSPSNVSTETK